ncbi:MAG: HEPN domain-containing protein [Sedimentisphaerales bacterium]
MDNQSEHAGRWFDKAKSDLLNADNNLAAQKVPYDTVCFHCQQAAEKLLKGLLVAHGYEYPITHNLFVVLEKVLEFDPLAESLRETLALLNPYSVEVRYPGDAWMPTPDDAKEARQAAQEVYEWVHARLERLF